MTNPCYTRGITPKRVTGGGVHGCDGVASKKRRDGVEPFATLRPI